MGLSLETLASILRTGKPVLVQGIDLMKPVIIRSNDLTQSVNFATRISDCDSHSPAYLDLFISSDASICSTMVFPPLGNFDHVVVSVSILTFHQTQTGCPFHGIAYDYSRADWDHLCDPLRDVSWEDISNSVLLLLVNFVIGFKLELMYISLIVSIRPSLTWESPWFSVVRAAAIVHRNHFFRLYQQNQSSEPKVKFIQASNHCKRVPEAVKLYVNKTKVSITSGKL